MAYYHTPHLHFCGCYYLTGPIPLYGPPPIQWLPQLALSAHTTIMSTTSRTVLKQTFSNPSTANPIPEATYTFPLYDGVGVVGFTCRIGKKVITGLVKEKAKARAVYDAAVERGETAGLLTQLPESSDVFTTRIGNIPAGETVVVEITYFGELKHDAEVDGIRFTIPTRIAPRYGSLPGGSLPTNVMQRAGKTGIEITVDVCMPEGSNIRGLQSPSHPIAVTMGALSGGSSKAFEPHKGGAALSLGTAELEKDFVLLVLVPDIAKPQALLETHPTIEGQRTLMCTLVPKFALQPGKPEVVFLVDRSGSMSGSMEVVIKALKVFLKSLPVGVKFNICSFGSRHSLLWKRSQTYDQSTLKDAIKHVEKMDANFGGTEMYAPFKAVIENRYKDLPLEVMLLTDGEIWNQEQLFTYLNKAVGDSDGAIRVFTLGIGNAVSHSLIEGIARAGNGFSQAVGLEEKLDAKIVRMLKGGLSPHVRDYSLEVKYARPPAYHDDEGYDIIEKVSEGLRLISLQPPAPKEPQKKISLFDEDVDMDRPPSPKPEDLTGATEKYAHLPPVPPPKVLQTPAAIPPLFPFSRTVVYLMLSPQACRRTPSSVILRGTAPQGPLELEIPVQILPGKGETFHQLAARKAVGELEEGRGWLFSATDEGGVPIKERFEGRFSDMVEREAVRLGVEFQVGGKWCSFVAVESNDAEIAAKAAEAARKAKDLERKDSEKVLLLDRGTVEYEKFDKCEMSEDDDSYTPSTTEDTRSVASSAISTGTLVSTNTMPPSSPPAPLASGTYRDAHAAIGGARGGRGGGGAMRATRRLRSSSNDGSSVAELAEREVQKVVMEEASPRKPYLHSSSHSLSKSPRGPPPQPRKTSPQMQQGQMAPSMNIFQGYAAAVPPSDGTHGYPSLSQPQSFGAPAFGSPAPAPERRQGVSPQFASAPAPPAPGGLVVMQEATIESYDPTIEDSVGLDMQSVELSKEVVSAAKRFSLGARSGAPAPALMKKKSKAGGGGVMGALGGAFARKGKSKAAAHAGLATEAEKVMEPLPQGDALHNIIALQGFEGSWELTAQLCTLLGVGKIDDVAAGRKGEERKVWATVLVLVWLEARMAGDKDTWELVADKAWDWLRSQDGFKEDVLVAEAKKVVGG